MATALPVLERENTNERSESSLKAYGKLSGGAEPASMTEEQKALKFNARISENYQKLINPDLKKAEDIMGASAPETFEQPIYDTPEAYARATLYPERTEEQAVPQFRHQRVTEDIFRADSPLNARAETFAMPQQAVEFEQPVFAPQTEHPEEAEQFYAEEANEDLKPTATTIQYRSDLYREEKQTVVEEQKKYSMTAKGKLLMAIYAVVVVVVLALIIVNTSVLKTLDSEAAAYEEQLRSTIAQAEQLADDIDAATSEETIIRWGNENGMRFTN